MGKIREFSIQLHNNAASVYYPGQIITGIVVMDLISAVKIRYIWVEIAGRSVTKVPLSNRGSNRSQWLADFVTQRDCFIDEKKVLWDGTRNENLQLGSGRHELDFAFPLPCHYLPSSYEGGKCCNIRYLILARICRPWKMDYVTKTAFTVLEMVDINRPELTVKELNNYCT
ncbi:uncharacterized protein TRIADDRAFT_30250 [Trichoplax adhaerens]|uniref:Arrestin-like N-terminal domain-containing protein n=1 Tax=Trichoplax adhaerens TaxID=10228 RepID=B3S6V9_TRIAD|nr:hypothetical protein TRIADDRAFT_30250 [Trichoplax adhaerens]EDV21377.1 hypothetical protein TRIADDRAFT_30250 [Trichoplax adhaerens]|eukprot:XP_002115977.1 hypothetical protein TRIADDRAFT_30250 [Trichoplax adhaerens]